MISTIVTTRTSTQIRKHSQTYHASLLSDSRTRFLKNHAEAQLKYRESLSTNKKTHIQESDTAAHQKHRQSLSPNTKAHILGMALFGWYFGIGIGITVHVIFCLSYGFH